MWRRIGKMFKDCLERKRPYTLGGIGFIYENEAVSIVLPSGRKLVYQKPRMGKNHFENWGIQFMGMDQTIKKWTWIDTYGGKLMENIVQAISRDLLAFAMQNLNKKGFDIIGHVHDEVICEIPDHEPEQALVNMNNILSIRPSWAADLPLTADGFITKYYKK